MSWLRIKKLKLELNNEIKKYHDDLDSNITKPKIIEQGKFGKDGYTISIGDVDKNARD